MALKRQKRKCTASIIKDTAAHAAQQLAGGQSPPIGAGEVLDPSPPGHSGKRGWRATIPASLPFVASPNAVKVVRQARSQCRSRRRLKVLMDLYKPPPPPDQPLNDACSAEASGQCERCRPWSGKRRCRTLLDALRDSSSVGGQSSPTTSVAKVVVPAPPLPHGGCQPHRVQSNGNSPLIDKTAPSAPKLLCSLPLTCKQSHLDKDADSIAQVGGEEIKLPIILHQDIKEDSVELAKVQSEVATAGAQKAESKQASKQGEEVNILCLKDSFSAETEPKPVIEKVMFTKLVAEANCTDLADRDTTGTTIERRQLDEEAVLHALQSVNNLIAEAEEPADDIANFQLNCISPQRWLTFSAASCRKKEACTGLLNLFLCHTNTFLEKSRLRLLSFQLRTFDQLHEKGDNGLTSFAQAAQAKSGAARGPGHQWQKRLTFAALDDCRETDCVISPGATTGWMHHDDDVAIDGKKYNSQLLHLLTHLKRCRKLLDVFDFSDTETMSPVRLRTSNGRARLQASRQETQGAGVVENQLSCGQRMLKLAQEAASTFDKAFEMSQSSREVMEQGDPERSDRRESDPIPLQHEAGITGYSWPLTNTGVGGHRKPQHEGVKEHNTSTSAIEYQLKQSSNIDLDLGAGSNPEDNFMEDCNITDSLASQVAPATEPLPGSSPMASACHQARHVLRQGPTSLLHPQPQSFHGAQSPSPPASPAHTGICVTLPPRSPSPRNRRQQKQTLPKSVMGILKTSQSCRRCCTNYTKVSERSMDHSKYQLMLADKANAILKEELHELREALQTWALPLLIEADAFKTVSALLSRSKLREATAQRYMSKIARSSDHFCRLMSQKQPRTPKKLRFADDAGLELCQIHTIGEHVHFDLKKPPVDYT
eukprot:SM000019S05076  [mRNA]  locus=s19:876765:881529:+ [translate_table: standard]